MVLCGGRARVKASLGEEDRESRRKREGVKGWRLEGNWRKSAATQ